MIGSAKYGKNGMAELGRPPISDEKVDELKSLYLSLLAAGKSEREINTVEGMCSWPTRLLWQHDADFSTQRKAAMKQGVSARLEKYEERCEEVYIKAFDDAASPQLVGALKLIGDHERWRASRLDRENFGDKQTLEHSGPEGKAIPLEVSVVFGTK